MGYTSSNRKNFRFILKAEYVYKESFDKLREYILVVKKIEMEIATKIAPLCLALIMLGTWFGFNYSRF